MTTENPENKTNNKELLRIKTGYGQHASPFRRHTAPFSNVLLEMEKNVRSQYTIARAFSERGICF